MQVAALSTKVPLQSAPLIVEADEATWRSLTVFCLYRVVLALLMGVAFALLNRFFNLGNAAPALTLPTLAVYTIASLALLVPARMREPNLTIQVTAGVFVDVLALTLLTFASGGVRCWGRGGVNTALGYGTTEAIGDDETPASAGDVHVKPR